VTHQGIFASGSALRNAAIFIIPEKGTEQIPALLIRRWSARNTSAVPAHGMLKEQMKGMVLSELSSK
jgi:hypothetical protein